MVANPRRRADVTDAALLILGRDGSRALTHRAVDRLADVPLGTCANYFPSRSALVLAVAHRIYDRLAPDPERLADLVAVQPSDAPAQYVGYVVERLTKNPDLARALIELRLEASRSSDVFDALAPFVRAGLQDDVSFHVDRGLPGGRETVLLLHHVVNGILLDHLSIPLDPRSDPAATAREAARRLTAVVPAVDPEL
ncbi:TetR/AcrR family transcriptional regulator [Tersicoccus sp. Bi-70]|uniref:TetR/AcrR family transcriptional regulator n=1 Tax=Tersicoccus sp. Bi-70 TaxID=1897634 RepID=UPI0009764943|nr:TetR/AcrR family transcriptional regulator [Tersicoccus sp. Bi-70]OMH35024.1 TetR family transcriptional regulator [Tersicoccus sp. Bi-70]